MSIQTVCTTLAPEQLGFCHSHEHLFIAEGQPKRINPALHIEDFARTVQELTVFYALGGNSIVDAQPLGCGRMEKWLMHASRETGIHIVASTGFHKRVFYSKDHWLFHYHTDQLTDIFVHEILTGMYVGTDECEPSVHIQAKAGIIKTAIDTDEINTEDKRLFVAAAQAAIKTGAPLMCHVESGLQAMKVIDFYGSYGVNPKQIIICHLDRDVNQLEQNKEVAATGVYLEYDTIGRYKYHSDEEEAVFIIKMLESGFEDQILLGLDTTRERLKAYGGSIGLEHMINSFIPLLKRNNVSENTIHAFFVRNPAMALNIKKFKGVDV